VLYYINIWIKRTYSIELLHAYSNKLFWFFTGGFNYNFRSIYRSEQDTTYLKLIEWTTQEILISDSFRGGNWNFLVIGIPGQFLLIFRDRYYLYFFFQTNWNDWSFSIWNRFRLNSYYFGWIICNCIFTIQTWWSVGLLIKLIHFSCGVEIRGSVLDSFFFISV
jgi:hypothetical protein